MTDKTNAYNVPTTGHVWDENLAELTNPPPRWWMLGLHASWILIALYGVFYPMWPGVTGYTKGILGWTAMKEYKEDLASLDKVRGKYEDQIKTASVDQIMANKDLKEYTIRSAKVLFGDNCAACHGSGGQGNPGFPVLADDDWLYGGDVDTILTTVTNGRQGMMPAKAGHPEMTSAQVDELANAIFQHKPTSSPLFTQFGCFACHGMDGKGMQAMGSANLTDDIWRFKAPDQLASIKYTITHGVNDPSDKETRNAVMPTFGKSKLSEAEIKKLAVYVHELGGGK